MIVADPYGRPTPAVEEPPDDVPPKDCYVYLGKDRQCYVEQNPTLPGIGPLGEPRSEKVGS